MRMSDWHVVTRWAMAASVSALLLTTRFGAQAAGQGEATTPTTGATDATGATSSIGSGAPDLGLVIFDFEGGLEGWTIPDWAQTSADYVGSSLSSSLDFVSRGKRSLQLAVNFPGGKWTGAYVERTMDVTDWTPFGVIAADVYLPDDAPGGLKAQFILGVGEKWAWTEMNRGLPLQSGQWTTITANLKPGSLDWKFFPDDLFRKDIRKIGIRIESDRKPAYAGPVYVDAIRLLK